MTTQNNLEIVWGEDSVPFDPGDIKYGIGWVAEIPTHEIMNFVLGNATANQLVIAERGFYDWEATIDYKEGVVVFEGGIQYTAIADSTGEQPSLDAAENFWVIGRVLGYSGVEKVRTKDFGVEVSGGVEAKNVIEVAVEAADEVSVRLKNASGQTRLRLNSVGTLLFSHYNVSDAFAGNWLVAYKNANVDLYFNDAVKLSTTAGGMQVTGNATVTSTSPSGDSAVRRDWVEANTVSKVDLLNAAYPIGAIHISINSANPSTFIGGTWVAFGVGRTLIGVDSGDFSTPEATGGVKDAINPRHTHALGDSGTHQHLSGEILDSTIPQVYGKKSITGSYRKYTYLTSFSCEQHYSEPVGNHTHSFTESGDTPTNKNLQPYIVTYMWKRVS